MNLRYFTQCSFHPGPHICYEYGKHNLLTFPMMRGIFRNVALLNISRRDKFIISGILNRQTIKTFLRKVIKFLSASHINDLKKC